MAHIRCWTCVGNGIVRYPGSDVKRCPDCGGTGADREKTMKSKSILNCEKHIPAPLPPLASERKSNK